MLIEKSLKEYILEASSGSPTPGGGSVSALVASLGAALTQMVGNLTFDKKTYDELSKEIKDKLENNFNLLEEKMLILNDIIDEDSKAFDGVMEAFKMPKDTEEEKKARSNKIQEGYKKALEVPLRCSEECFKVLELQEVFAFYGNKNAITDVGVGALLAYAGMEGALLNVKINLLSIKDEKYKKEIEERINVLLEEGHNLKEEIMKTVYIRLS